MSRNAGRSPKMSGHTSTPGAVPLDGCTKYASQLPSGVLIVTSMSVTATAFTTFGSAIATPAASSTPNCRRVTSPPASYSSRSSSE
jgi:hypothetical protein